MKSAGKTGIWQGRGVLGKDEGGCWGAPLQALELSAHTVLGVTADKAFAFYLTLCCVKMRHQWYNRLPPSPIPVW